MGESQPPGAPPRRRTGVAAAVVGAYWAVALLSFLRGYDPGLPPYGTYPWGVTYEFGFIKRGLAGTVFQLLTGGQGVDGQVPTIVALHLVTSVALVVLSGLWLGRIVRRQDSWAGVALLAAVAALFATSQFLPTLGFLPGYVDGVMLVLVLACGGLIAAGRTGWAVALGAVGPLLHESFAFYWIPLAVAAIAISGERFDARRRRLWWLGLPVVSAVAVVLLHDQRAAVATIEALGLRANIEAVLVDAHFGQSLASAAARIIEAQPTYWPIEVWGLIAFAGPALVMVGLYATARRGRLSGADRVALAAGVVSPLALLAIVTDLSRFLVAANLMVFIVILILEARPRSAPEPSRVLLGAVAVLCAVSVVMPFVYTDIDAGDLWENGPIQLFNAPSSRR